MWYCNPEKRNSERNKPTTGMSVFENNVLQRDATDMYKSGEFISAQKFTRNERGWEIS